MLMIDPTHFDPLLPKEIGNACFRIRDDPVAGRRISMGSLVGRCQAACRARRASGPRQTCRRPTTCAGRPMARPMARAVRGRANTRAAWPSSSAGSSTRASATRTGASPPTRSFCNVRTRETKSSFRQLDSTVELLNAQGLGLPRRNRFPTRRHSPRSVRLGSGVGIFSDRRLGRQRHRARHVVDGHQRRRIGLPRRPTAEARYTSALHLAEINVRRQWCDGLTLLVGFRTGELNELYSASGIGTQRSGAHQPEHQHLQPSVRVPSRRRL